MGLKGNSGIVRDDAGNFVGHINAAYDAGNGRVFAFKELGYWRRMRPGTAKRWGWQVVTCSVCGEPAVQLDHMWPYETWQNRCETHLHADVPYGG